jgi:hypothetical protein
VLRSVNGSSGTGSSSSSGSGSQGALSAFNASVSGTVGQSQAASGLVSVNIALSVQSNALPSLDLQILGQAQAGGGVEMTSSSVSAGTATAPQLYTGRITSLVGTNIAARVASASGQVLDIQLVLALAGGDSATGTVTVTPAQ